MVRKVGMLIVALLAAWTAPAQERRPRIDVEHYRIDAEINPRTQTLSASVQVRFVPLDDSISSAVFELHNALNVTKVAGEGGQQLQASRNSQDFSVRLSFSQPLQKGTPQTVTFQYDGRLSGTEESPIYGVKFAAIKNDYSFLLYPARWFPVSGYTADRYTADLKITVPAGAKVLSSGLQTTEPAGEGKTAFLFRFTNESFPGSLAVVSGDPATISSSGVSTTVYFRGAAKEAAAAYGEETGKIMAYLTSVFGLPPQANLTLVETEDGAPNGYSAPGLVFLSPKAIGTQPNTRVLVNQVARQWWGSLLSPVNRNHLWLQNGAARYAELMYIEHVSGPAALENEIRDVYVEALTVDNPPLIQASRLEDYSPEYWALTAGKGAAVFHMLRYLIGDAKFMQLLKTFPDQNPWKAVSTDDFRKTAETVAGENLGYFFIQWIESSGAPEFKLTYTIFRTQKGFRVMGKIAQDLDTFRMPLELKIETEGNPEEKKVEVMGLSSEFSVETFGKPRNVVPDPNNRVLRFSNAMRVAVAIRRGEQFTEIGEFTEALREYQRALDVNRNSSLAHYRIGEVFLLQNNYQSAVNSFREALNGDLEPKWTEVWAHINLGKVFDITGQRERALNEYKLAMRTNDNTQGAQEEAAKYSKQPYERPRRAEP